VELFRIFSSWKFIFSEQTGSEKKNIENCFNFLFSQDGKKATKKKGDREKIFNDSFFLVFLKFCVIFFS